MHKKRKKAEDMLEFYRKSKKVPVAWQLFAKSRFDNNWYPIGQQHKYRKDAETDKSNIFVGLSPANRATFKEFKVIQTPATRNEIWQRRVLKSLEKHPQLRGFLENFIGVTEFKVYGEVVLL